MGSQQPNNSEINAPSTKPKLLDQMRTTIRLRGMSYSTEQPTPIGRNDSSCFITNDIQKTWERKRFARFWLTW